LDRVVVGTCPVNGISGTHAKPEDFDAMKALDGTSPFEFRRNLATYVVPNARCYLEANEDGTVAEFSIGTTS